LIDLSIQAGTAHGLHATQHGALS